VLIRILDPKTDVTGERRNCIMRNVTICTFQQIQVNQIKEVYIAKHTVLMEEMINMYTILVVKHRRGWDDNVNL
jgi:hypothetical protein